MDRNYDFEKQSAVAQSDAPKIAYVRPVKVSDLPQDVQARAKGRQTLYALHDEDGAPLALVAERDMAFMLARQNDLAPVNAH
ncbi:MAG: hypothetical protein ACJA1E_001589 [Paracoccaceae bacterium]|jgi:hypothetical protein